MKVSSRVFGLLLLEVTSSRLDIETCIALATESLPQLQEVVVNGFYDKDYIIHIAHDHAPLRFPMMPPFLLKAPRNVLVIQKL